ncbi:MAG TPA: DNA-binding response regulator [Coriobacteriia bacterium]|nr:DNA-binding response regulator [Coriobacteriia bacterium]
MEEDIRILIVDDDPIVRMSLATILNAQSDMSVCGDVGNGFEAIETFAGLAPDILLMDIRMPDCGGIEAARVILDKTPEARVVFLTTFSDDEYIVAALKLGARGYLIKQEVANIAPALRSVMAGQMVLGSEVLSRSVLFAQGEVKEGREPSASDDSTSTQSAVAPPNTEGLSERELEIIELIAQGLDNREIAARIYIGEGTVRNHVSTILQKLQLKNRTQLAIYYYRGR